MRRETPARLNLFCPTLYTDGGHERGYTAGLTKALAAQGVTTHILYPDSAPDLFEANATRIKLPRIWHAASSSLAQRLRSRMSQTHRARGFAHAFGAAEKTDVTFIHSAGFADMALAGEIAAKTKRKACLLLRFDHYDVAEAMHIVVTLANNPWVTLVTDSEELAESFGQLTGTHLLVLPPPTNFCRIGPIAKHTPLRLAYLGGARRSKGFHRLPQIMSRLLPLIPNTEVFVQAYRHADDGPDPVIDDAEAALRTLPQVTLERNVAAQETYQNWLASLDGIILPYDPFTYRAVSSGIFVEAMASGLYALVPKGTWMSFEAERNGLSRALALDFESDCSLTNAAKILSGVGYTCPSTDVWAAAHSYESLATGLLEHLRIARQASPF